MEPTQLQPYQVDDQSFIERIEEWNKVNEVINV